MGKTRGVHETTPELRNRMVGMYEAGLGLRDIAAAVNCSQRTVKRWLNRFDKEGTVETRERCGRKRATTTEQDDAIIRLATQTPITAAKAVLPALGLTCSVDTIRERLHKAGIHNWSPSRKHMQRITFGSDGDGATVQQAVWRPTGTQLGKKKLVTKESNNRSKRIDLSTTRKRIRPLKVRARDFYVGDGAPRDGSNKQSLVQPEFTFPQQSVQQQPPPTDPLAQGSNDMQVGNESLPNDQTQFGHPLSLVQATEPPVYQHHSGLNIAQNWPLDLVQGSHHYQQSQPHSMSHEQPPPQQQLQELHTQREQEHQAQQAREQAHQQHIQEQQQQQQQLQSHHHHLEQHQAQQHSMDHRVQQQIVSHTESPSTNDEPGAITRSDSCSNSRSSNDQLSDLDDLSKDGSKEDEDERSPRAKKRKKKGGKVKGTLETSVEIRNRMIGMSEAGLSTLSIALAINRSERTVKRWLERWNKEGNVQTKERKGRRRITTKEQDDAIIAMATQHPLTAAKHVAPALGLNCSVDTIRERLHKAGIHSWKLGKKQGEGNAVHTVHLWQPSGNRPNKPKLSTEKRKKSSVEKKRVLASTTTPKRSQRKKKTEDIESKGVTARADIIVEPAAIQFNDNGPLANYVTGPEMMQPVHNLSASSLVSSPPVPQVPSVSQSMQAMGPIMQQRPDCRMATSLVPSGLTNPTVYPSCMVSSGNSHASHMDQPDPLNYEPYIWSF